MTLWTRNLSRHLAPGAGSSFMGWSSTCTSTVSPGSILPEFGLTQYCFGAVVFTLYATACWFELLVTLRVRLTSCVRGPACGSLSSAIYSLSRSAKRIRETMMTAGKGEEGGPQLTLEAELARRAQCDTHDRPAALDSTQPSRESRDGTSVRRLGQGIDPQLVINHYKLITIHANSPILSPLPFPRHPITWKSHAVPAASSGVSCSGHPAQPSARRPAFVRELVAAECAPVLEHRRSLDRTQTDSVKGVPLLSLATRTVSSLADDAPPPPAAAFARNSSRRTRAQQRGSRRSPTACSSA